jgi:ribonuclease P protein component
VSAKVSVNTLNFLRVGVLSNRKNIRNAIVRNAVKRFVLDNSVPLINETGSIGTDLLIIVVTPIIKLDLQTKNRLLQDLNEIKTSLLKTTK